MPSIVDGPENKIRREQDDVTFRCFSTGDPPPTVSWIFNNSVIQEGNKYTIGDIQQGVDFGSLTIRNLTYYDRGTYTCRASNAIGNATDQVQLQVQGIHYISLLHK